jgi:cytoskeletal protein CcmA (bactofilin family)
MAHHGRRYALLSTCVLVFLIFSTMAFAKNPSDRTSWGNNITIGPNDQVSDVTCMACTIRIRGQVAGDATAIGGSIIIEDKGQVAGDVTAIAGNARLDKEVKVAGDVTVIGGELRRDPEASVSGDVTAMGGRGWIVPIFLAPFVILGLLVAFVIWLVQRARRPSLPPVAA